MQTRSGGIRKRNRKGLRGSESGSETKPNYTEGVVLNRPSWYDHTRQEVLDKANPKQVNGETQYQCAKGDKCSKPGGYHPASNMQVDHKTAWQEHIDNKVDDISDKNAVREAYNDPSNLQALCGSCNSKKGNRKGAALAKQFKKK
ncbi:MAG: HNH endonuclease [Acaryochloridaceae cyanobacterium RU_4_10]|nr:HNH endonuclease [Acaryochloridaceae cyanobacterium RU_4_10]